MTDLLVAEGVLWLTTGPVLAKERIANGLVVDLVLAEAVTVDERWELRPTGVMPQDPLLADAVRLLQASPPPVAATAFTKELAHPRQSHQPPLPLVPPLV